MIDRAEKIGYLSELGRSKERSAAKLVGKTLRRLDAEDVGDVVGKLRVVSGDGVE